MKRIALTPLAVLAVAGIPHAQDAQKNASARSVDELVDQLESGQDALEAFRALVERAKNDRIAVLAPINQLMRATGDARVKARCRAVLDAAIEDYLAEHKKREIEERYEDLQTACKDLLAAAREKRVAGSVTADVAEALEALETSLASPKPLNAPPLRVPSGRRGGGGARGKPRQKPRGGDPAPAPGGLEGYEKIQVGDQTMLVPAGSLPEHYVAEVVDGQLRIIRFDSEAEKKAYLAKKNKKDKDENRKNGGNGMGSRRPERP